ncbi:DUF4397 domain-containing protein [Bacillus songklensis]|uniref:DUF4397 domain-containing protein n=1 Tax=Bacillus songklensis TaxID=1069116 RepID=A0ABV8B4C6_9BACI
MKRFLFLFMTLLLTILPVTTVHTSAETPMESMVRIVHASPDTPSVDIYLNDEQVVSEASFSDVSDYLSVPEGTNTVDIYASGTKGQKDPVLSASVNVKGGMTYTLAAANTLQNLELEVLEDDMGITRGKAKIRVSHFAPDAPAVNVGVKNGDVLFNNLAFKQTTEYKELKPNTYDLTVTTADGNQLELDLSGTRLAENTVYTVLAISTGDQLEALILEDQSMMPSEMPKTGMGGTAANSPLDAVKYMAAGAALITIAAFVFRRKHA